jgi:hypothetical protein
MTMVEEMKLSHFTYQFSVVILVLTALHTWIYSGMTGVLFSSAVALIAAAFIDEFEIVAGITVLIALFYTVFLKKQFREGFQSASPEKIAAKLNAIKNKPATQAVKPAKRGGVKGVYSTGAEGFEDLQPKEPKEGESKSSTEAPTKITNEVDEESVKEVSKNVEEIKKKSDKEIEKEEFQSATNHLFKLGQLPSENEEGPKLDPGQTLMKAMNSLDPSVISSMTTDTKKLLETQKNLMGMLGQMRPILADGKELLSTFSGMFGGKM